MIEVFGISIDSNDPMAQAIAVGAAVVLLILLLLIMAVRAAGRSARLTEPLAQDIDPKPEDLELLQWFYYPTQFYGGPKYDAQALVPQSVELSADRRTLTLQVPELKAGYVVYLALNPDWRSQSGLALWTREVWYTLNAIPGADAD